MEETLCEVRDQLSRSGVVTSDLAVPLFDSLLRVALAEVSSCPGPPEEKPDRVSSPGLSPGIQVSFQVQHDIPALRQSFSTTVGVKGHCIVYPGYGNPLVK